MTAKESLFNYSAISKLLTGKSETIRPNRVPKKYKRQIETLMRWEGYIRAELGALESSTANNK